MEFYGPSSAMEGTQSDPQVEWNSQVPETGIEEPMWRLGLGSRDSYPERTGEPDCIYFMRTGTCSYGSRCRFNHPRDRSAVAGAVRQGGEYPEREDQPACQYFLKNGTCKFGASCKYHHPKYRAESMSSVPLNYYGHPLRPGEKECSYYVKTGQCKFGITCKFDHPQPASASALAPDPAFYPMVQSPSVPSPQQYGGMGSWQVARPALLPGSYVQGPYGPVLLSPGMVPFQAWSSYPAPLSPAATAYAGPYQSLHSFSAPSSSSQKENMLPERPGEPECQYYMKTGECKFGLTCRYHHPPDRISPKTNYVLSRMGLPLRMGVPTCPFYAQHGVCKFGPACKYDHPMGTLNCSPSASSLTDMPVAPYPVGSSLATLALSSSSSELRPEFIAGSNRDSLSTTRIPSSENASSGLVGLIFSQSGHVPHLSIQVSGQSSTPSRGGSGTGHGGEIRSLS